MAEVVTGEAVILDVPSARFPSRALALALDMIIQLAVLFALAVIIGIAGGSGALNPASGAAAEITAVVAVIVGYPVIWETLTRGRSPGKFALGLRVVGDDGGPERFRQALVRGLAAAVEIWGLLGCPALICSLLTARGKRLGDLFAGTFVVQQRLPAAPMARVPLAVHPWLAQWAAGLELSGLDDQTAEAARRYLARLRELTPEARAHLGERLARTVSSLVSPPPPPHTPAGDYLAAVLAERGRRQRAQLMPPAAAYPPPAAAYPPPAAAPPAWAPPPAPGFPAPPPAPGFPASRPSPAPGFPAPPPAPGFPASRPSPAPGFPPAGAPPTGAPPAVPSAAAAPMSPGNTYDGTTGAGWEGEEPATPPSEPQPGQAPGTGQAPGGFVPPA